MNNSDDTIKVTQYTINDSVCPPTDPDTLEKIVQKHIHTLPRYWFSRPIAKHTAEAFQDALDFVHEFRKTKQLSDDSKVNVILDSGCGTGKSSILLGEMYPHCVVIGVDQSIARLSRNKSYKQSDQDDDNNNNDDVATSVHNMDGSDNVLLLRAELSDFWKCCLSSTQWFESVSIYKHYLLYPNPYPKKSRLKSRFYAHPAFPLLMMTTMMDNIDPHADQDRLVVRSNWKGYLDEFKSAVDIWQDCGGTFSEWKETYLSSSSSSSSADETNNLGTKDWYPDRDTHQVNLESSGPNRMDIVIRDDPTLSPMTNFEAKYLECGEAIYELTTKLVQ